MHTDLGTWRGTQAAAVVRVLERAGLTPQTEDAVDGTRITVPADQNGRAHRVLADAMDDIAAARTRAGAEAPGTARSRGGDGAPLATQRLRNLAPLVGLVSALLLAAMIPPGGLRTTVFVFALVGFGVVWARRNGGDDEYGPPPG